MFADRIVKQGGTTYDFEWRMNGRRLAFTWAGEEAGLTGLYSSGPDGSDVQNVSESLEVAPDPGVSNFAWSPDGDRIAYAVGTGPTSSAFAFQPALYTNTPDGPDEQQVTDSEEPLRNIWRFAWSRPRTTP